MNASPPSKRGSEFALRTVREVLARCREILKASNEYADLDDAQQDQQRTSEAREILSAVMGIAPGEVSRASDRNVDSAVQEQAIAIAIRRSTGVPLAYCVGSAAFRHIVLRVDSRVLIPRPETEVVVDEALKVAALNPGGIAVDIGTGSGAIAISLATEGEFDQVIATDLSHDALAVASENAKRILEVPSRLQFREGSDFDPLFGVKARVIVSNPPYISFEERFELPASVREWEPSMALFAEDGGMARYDALLAGAPDHLESNGWLVLEVDSRRASETARRAQIDGRYTNIRLKKDLAGRDRVLVAQYKPV